MKTIRIFISSPGDVAEERDRARQVVDQLQRRYAGRLKLVPVLWEDLPLQADMSFQQGIDLVLSEEQGIDIAVFILWSRLGSPLGALTRKPDGSAYRSGTEREFDLMLQAREQSGGNQPAILAYVRQDDASFKKVLSDKAVGDLEALLQQHKLVQQFIQEQFHDPQSGTNTRAYHTFNEPVSFATRLREHLRQQLDRLLPEHARLEARWERPPFQGLEVFDVEHADIFFGRELVVCEVQLALRDQAAKGCAFVLILGASGSGKSSLARAGVLAALIRDNLDRAVSAWRWGVLLPEAHANNLCLGLAQTLASPSAMPELREDENSIPELGEALDKAPELAVNLRIKSALKKAGEGKPGEVRLLLLVDQLEELFTHPAVSAADITVFLQALEALARSGSVWVLATVRSDFYARCQQFPVLVRLKEGKGQYDLLPPGPAELQRIITEPVRLVDLRYEQKEDTCERLDQRILNDAVKNPEALPLLEYLLLELYEHRSSEGVLTCQAYEELGGVERALGRRAEAVFLSLPVEAQEALGEVLHALLTVSEQDENAIMRRRARLANLTDTPAKRSLVEALLSVRLLVADKDQAGQPVAEVAHEALLRGWERASQWAKDHREFLRSRERLAQACARWRAEAQDSDFLLPAGKPLVEAEDLLRTRSKWLSTDLAEYVLRCSAASKDRERRGLEGLRAVALRSLVLVVLVCSPLVGLTVHTASQERRHALAVWRERARQVAQAARRAEEELIEQTRQLLLAVAESTAVRSGSPEACKKSLEEVFASYPGNANLGVIDTNGQVVASALPLAELGTQADRAFVRRVEKTRAFAMGDYLTGLLKGKPALTFGCPVFDTSGRVQSVVVGWMGLEGLTRPGSALATNVPKGASWTLVRPNGNVLLSYPGPWPPSGQPFPNRVLLSSGLTQPDDIIEALGPRGAPNLYAFEPLDTRLVPGHAVTILGIPRSILFAEANQALIRNLFWIGLVAGSSLVLGWFGSKLLILRRVETLVSPRGVNLRLGKGTRSRGRKIPSKD